MRLSARAILITKENKLLLMRRFKPDTGEYYVTIGGGVEDGETSEQDLVRELKEESGSLIGRSIFTFRYEDEEKDNAMDFFVACETDRVAPTGTERIKWNTPDNQYELVEVTLEKTQQPNLKPDILKNKILDCFKSTVNKITE